MPTPAQIDEQIKLERDQIAQGLKRLHKNTRQLEEKSYGSATVYGITSIDSLLPLVVKRIKDTTNRLHKGQAGKSFKEIHQYLADLEPLAAAAIACKLTFDKVFSIKENSNQLITVSEAIGQAIENECQMRHYEAKAPALLHTLKENYWHKSCGTHQKVVVIQTLMNRYGISNWTSWGRSNRIKLGTWLLDCIMSTSEWFYKDMRRVGRKTTNYIVPTPEFIAIKDQVMNDAELFAPLAWPMLIEPNDWGEKPGGYLLNEVMKGHEMVRRGNHTRIQGDKPIAFLNKIQKVGYKLNPFVVNVAEQLDERGISVGKFIPIVELPLPPKPPDIADNKDSRKAYRRAAAEVMNNNAGAFRRSCRTRMTMEAVRRFKGKEFFIPWSFDYRGRAYPIPAFLTPQDTDFGKALLNFSNEEIMGDDAEKWLAFQVATTYGLSKETWDIRQSWVKANECLITRVAKFPIESLSEWEVADEPWQFLAACEEYYAVVTKQLRRHTRLPIATDATCSGLQILAALAKDRKTAQLVNVLPSDKPQDAYKVVADTAKPHIPKYLHNVWNRSKVKRTVMTIPYNAKPFSNRSYIRDALKEDGVEIEKDDLTLTVKAVRDAMNEIVPGPMAVMSWIEKEVSKQFKDNPNLTLTWTTPSGFVVNQRIQKKKVEKLNLQLLGRCKLSVATDSLLYADKLRHKAATAPNLIHSLDATLLHLSTLKFCGPIALIHDSVLCRATDMTALSSIVRETYMEIFTKQNVLEDFALAIGADPKTLNLPIIGDLEPSEVIDSTYFFC
jgi:DNA-directed RNA polymerase